MMVVLELVLDASCKQFMNYVNVDMYCVSKSTTIFFKNNSVTQQLILITFGPQHPEETCYKCF